MSETAPVRHGVSRIPQLRQALALLVMLALAGAWVAAPARADGDPASDVLATQSLFLPQDAAGHQAQQDRLMALLQEASRGGFPVRVALIASPTDLGSVTELWHQPQSYARFLGTELSLVYRGLLVVVMPNGVGLDQVGGSPAAQGSLNGTFSAGAGLSAAAIEAIRTVAAAARHPLAPPNPISTGPAATTGGSAMPWIALIAGAIVVALAWTASLRARPPSLGRQKPRAA